MTELTDDQVKALLDGATPGRRVQFHGSYCPEAVGTPFTDWDTSHDVSVIRPDGSRYRLAHYKHASDAYLSQMAPDLARALLDARAELARLRADAQAAVVLVVEQAAKVPRLHAKQLQQNGLTAMSSDFDHIEEDIRALAPADGVAMVQELRAERDYFAAENASLMAREEGVAMALKGYRATFCHASPGSDTEFALFLEGFDAAADIARAALAQTPTEPGDGWTWNERLGWIGPDGKPADPRRRG